MIGRLRRRVRLRNDDRGVAAVEMAMVLTLLLMIALGAFEYGMAFRNWLTVTTAGREGARVAASAATFTDADCIILEATAGAFQSFDASHVHQIHIYKSVPVGEYPSDGSLINMYRPVILGEDTSGLTLVCGNWVLLNGAPWSPAERDATEGSADWIGVRVIFNHVWNTGFLWWSGQAQWTDDTIFRLEPPDPNA